MTAGLLDLIDTPRQGNARPDGVDWIADNGAFSDKWDADEWWAWLIAQPRTCRFAVAPDVVGDWLATLERFDEWEPRMHAEGFPVALVAQDGATPDTTPWERLDALFIGGSTAWKLSAESVAMIRAAKARGLWVHIGRVNSLRRLRWAAAHGADSADGTFLTFAPNENLPKLTRWLSRVNAETFMDFGGAA